MERLRSAPLSPADRELRSLRAQNRNHPDDLPLALELGRRLIEKSRAEADPRHLGYAEAALGNWWNQPAPPNDVLLLRATVKQSQHDFSGALDDLSLLLQNDPRNAQAWLTRATILTVLGDYAGARRACLSLAQLGPGHVAVTAAANVSGLTGGAERALARLRQTMQENAAADVSEKLWMLTIMAESAARLGKFSEAENCFKTALALGKHDPYLLGAYADFLLDDRRAPEAAKLLAEETRADGLLLRLALAEKELTPRPAEFGGHVDLLRARFEAARLRGESVHQREESRFRLHLLRQPREALTLAQANWRVQREPADARVLLEAALAAGDAPAAAPVMEFVQTNHLEDVALARLMNALKP